MLFQGIALGVMILWFIRSMRSTRKESSFKIREAELKKKPVSGGPSLADAKIKINRPLQLGGIQINAPAHQILGIQAQASESEIQRAYREKMKQYHPDVVGRPGSREWQDAQKIAEAIIRAKDEMMKQRRT